MIYLVEQHCDLHEQSTIQSVWDVTSENLHTEYKEFMYEKGRELNIIINREWLNMMNHLDWHKSLSEEEYKSKKKIWKKVLKEYPIERYIQEVGGKQLEFQTILG